MFRSFATPLNHGLPPATGIVLLVGLIALVLLRRHWDDLARLLPAVTGVSIVYILSVPMQGYRILFVLLPVVAAGYAAIAERLVGATAPLAAALRVRRA